MSRTETFQRPKVKWERPHSERVSMPRFHCQAIDSQGREIKETIEAATEAQAFQTLANRKLTIVEMKELRTDPTAPGTTQEGQTFLDNLMTQIPMADILGFYEQLSFLISAGIPIHLCLRMNIQNTKNPLLVDTLKKVMFDLTEGVAFSSALQKYPRFFPALHTQLIGIGEKTGALDKALIQLIDLTRERLDIREKVVKASSYPFFLIGMSLSLVLAMILFVFPKFQEIFASFEVKLPPLTAFLMGLSATLNEHVLLILVGVCAVVGGILYFFKSEAMSDTREQILVSIPLVREVFLSMFVALFSKTLSSLLRSGIPLLEALVICQRTLPGGLKQKFFNTVIAGVREGETASSLMERNGFVPELVWQLTAVGEKTGDLATIMDHLFTFYKKKCTDGLNKMTGILKPALMFFSAGIVMTIAGALFIPLFKLGSSMKRGD